VTCAGRNGNLALNTNPMPDGRIEPRQAERFREIGAWLKKHGESIYGTRGGPFVGLESVSTHRGNRIYLHVLRWYGDKIRLPAISRKIVSCSLLTGGRAELRQAEGEIEFLIPPEHRQALDTIVALDLDGPAADVKPAAVKTGSLTFGRKVTVSSVYPEPAGGQYQPAYAVDGDPDSGWTFARGLKSAWLEVDLGRPQKFDRALIHERYDRVRAFRVQAFQGDRWVTLHEGKRIGENLMIRFPAVTAQRVRLEVLDTTINPLVAEFHLLAAE